jgi:3',5'-cyclic-AMP phosphodiesterase
MNRRHFLRGAGIAAAASTFNLTGAAAPAPSILNPKRSVRIAHLTDIHVMPITDLHKDAGFIYDPAESMAKALHHVQSLADRPDWIFNGGDCIMDALKQTREYTKAQWDLWQSVLRNELELPLRSAIGNHDVWGWANPDALQRSDYGKKWAIEELKLSERHYSFDSNGWRFIVLDSSFFAPSQSRGYMARLDEEQFAWLASTLEATPRDTHIAILSHIPIISFSPFFDGDNETTGMWQVPGEWMHIDARRIKDLFHKHANIRVCLSGHIHLQDEVKYLGIRYFCNGAVSGGWWKGNYQEFPPAYALVDFYEDGTVSNQLIPYLT